MDFLDQKKLRRHNFLLYAGYIFIGIAVLISTIVLVYQANGFGVNNKGEVVRNGLLFMSSQPNPADIYVDNKKNDAQTNSRITLPAGDYQIRLTRTDYRDWTRTINVQGGDVQNFDYPFLIPTKLQTDRIDSYAATPGIATQSRDRRWLMVQQSPDSLSFNVYDLNRDNAIEPTVTTIPANVATAADGTVRWEVVQWSNDNDHVLLKHTYGTGYEYIVVSRTDPEETVNVTKALGVNADKLTLIDNKFDQYHVLVAGTLSSAKRGDSTLTKLQSNVYDYKSFGTNTILYATPAAAPANRTNIAMLVGDRDYTLRQIDTASIYNLDIANYRGDQYVVVGSAAEKSVYVYKNPVDQLRRSNVLTANAERAIRVDGATYVSFSPNTQYVIAENGTSFGAYDIFNKQAHTYTINEPLDAPAVHAEWMDAGHLTYTTGGKQIMFDFDGDNYQELMTTQPTLGAYYAQDYRYILGFSSGANGVIQLNRTALRTEADL